MKNGNRLRHNLAGQLLGRHKKRNTAPHQDIEVEVEVPSHVTQNPLYLATYVGGQNPYEGEIDVEAGPTPPKTSLDLPWTGEPCTSDTVDPTPYESPLTNPSGGFFHSKISEEQSMYPTSGRRLSDSQLLDYHSPALGPHLNVIGTPPIGYQKWEEPPSKRFLKEAHRLWIAPMLAGLPAWFDNWWKTGRKNASRSKPGGADALLAPLREVSLSTGQSLTVMVAFSVFGFLFIALIVYALLEQRRRSREDVIDLTPDNPKDNQIVQLVPRRKYLMDITLRRLGRPSEPMDKVQEKVRGPQPYSSFPLHSQYPPLTHHPNQRR